MSPFSDAFLGHVSFKCQENEWLRLQTSAKEAQLSGGLNVRQKQVLPSETSAPVPSAEQINASSDNGAPLRRRRRVRVLFILGGRRAGAKIIGHLEAQAVTQRTFHCPVDF